MLRFSEELKTVDASGFKALMNKWTDLDQWITFFAISRLIEHWDGPLAWYCGDSCKNHNFFFYESAVEDKILIVPWDYDMALFYIHPQRNGGVPAWTDVDADCSIAYETAFGASAGSTKL